MNDHLFPGVPLVVIYNNLEVFYRFLSRGGDESFLLARRCHGDRALFWLRPDKLLFVTMPIPLAAYMAARTGYSQTRICSPSRPSYHLSRDILSDERLVGEILEYAGSERVIQLVPYATTPEFLLLADRLNSEYGLTVLLPESPLPGMLWLRDYVDTKSGFRTLASQWVDDPARLLPFGVVCRERSAAAQAVRSFWSAGKACVIKADGGESGLGTMILQPGDYPSFEDLQTGLQANLFLENDLVVVDEYIPSADQLSPSLELLIPAPGCGQPQITYLSQQLFVGFGQFDGVIISRELAERPWYPRLARQGLVFADRLQKMGYVGHFDLDVVVDQFDNPWLLEVNSRRTGGTHVHELACTLFGPDYLEQVTLLSHNRMPSGCVGQVDCLVDTIGDLMYPMQSNRWGVVVTISSSLELGEFGCILVAPTTADAFTLQQELVSRLAG